MYVVNDDLSIYCTRGDYCNIPVHHQFKTGDVLRFKVFNKKNCASVVIQRDFTVDKAADTFVIQLTGKDTKIGNVISKPVDYWYEVELNPDTNPQTIICYDKDGAKVFRLFPEGKDIDENDIDAVDTKTLQEIVDEAIEKAMGSGGFNGDGSVPYAVLYTEQKLTYNQQSQARYNIQAASKEEVGDIEDAVDSILDIQEGLIDGAGSVGGSGSIDTTNAVLYTPQNLNPTQQAQARQNIGITGTGADGKDGKNGTDGADGNDGQDGQDGVGISDVTVSAEGALIVTLTNGERFNLGNIKGEKGEPGTPGVAQTPLFANNVYECTDTTKVYVLPDGYLYAYMMSMGDTPNITIEKTAGGHWWSSDTDPINGWTETSGVCAKRTNIIPVTPGDTLAYKGRGDSGSFAVTWLNAQQAFISKEKINSTAEFVTVTAPAGDALEDCAAFAWFSSFGYTSNVDNVVLEVKWLNCQAAFEDYQWSNTGHAFVPADYEDRIIALEEKTKGIEAGLSDSLAGKKIVYDGDSICQGAYGGGGYAALIAEATGGSYVNQAVGGGLLTTRESGHSVVDNLVKLPKDGDIYCFQGGINDYWNEIPLGSCTEGDYTGTLDKTTICGALETIFRYAINNFVGKPVCFVITHKIQDTAYKKMPNENYTFAQCRDAMVQICEKYSIPYYDAFSESGLNGWNMYQSTFLNGNSEGIADGCHPNTEGYKRYYVPQLLSLFRRIMPG